MMEVLKVVEENDRTAKERTISAEIASHPPKKRSAFAGSRQTSEDSRNLRFHSSINVPPPPIIENAKKKADWKRRMSKAPAGLTRIRVGGHLNYKEIQNRFERQSTFHGISHGALAPNKRWRHFWHAIFTCCLIALIIQLRFLILKYREYNKTVDLDLKFENAPFPSITLCNLNPYKKSLIYNNPTTRDTMDAFASLVRKGDQTEGVAAILAAKMNSRAKRENKRMRRTRNVPRRYHQVYAHCLCDVDPRNGERQKGSCLAAREGKITVDISSTLATPLNFIPTKCLCQLDTVSHTLWPCFPFGTWKEKVCSECVDDSGHCPMRFYKGEVKYEDIKDKDDADLCLCHNEYNHCVENNEDGFIPDIDPDEDVSKVNLTAKARKHLEREGKIPTTTTTTRAPEVVQALGFSEVTDEIAIVAAAQQNLIYAVGDLKDTDKVELSHKKDDFILKCSFNQRDCDIANDFKLHYDQTYGNCYTFNWNRTSAVTAHRAGANYGLRVMLFADVSEYLPTSEAVGFRITVHDKWIVPFPDAFGYNAPIGFLSSFGVRMKQFLRIKAPHGHCLNGGENSDAFIYRGFNYSVEACHRSCTQKKICELCGCADPMYPLPKIGNFSFCHVTDTAARDCIRNVTSELGIQIAQGKLEDCTCHQPCDETNYEVTYSAARWPSGSARVAECDAADFLCLEKYRKNAAMIQIFYEELNYETLIESEAYTLSSLIADLGGVSGLWIGASIVSIFEIVSLIIFVSQAYVRKKKEDKEESEHRNSSSTLHKLSLSVQEVRHSISTHSSRSKQSLHSHHSYRGGPSLRSSRKSLDGPLAEDSEEESSEASARTQGSCRYLAPGEELPCLCKYNEMGHIVVMKALCPVHGYMVRRNYDYSLSNSEEGEDEAEDEQNKEEEEEEDNDPYGGSRRSSRRRKRKKKGEGTVEGAAERLTAEGIDNPSPVTEGEYSGGTNNGRAGQSNPIV